MAHLMHDGLAVQDLSPHSTPLELRQGKCERVFLDLFVSLNMKHVCLFPEDESPKIARDAVLHQSG
jgi:hypothetical protein